MTYNDYHDNHYNINENEVLQAFQDSLRKYNKPKNNKQPSKTKIDPEPKHIESFDKNCVVCLDNEREYIYVPCGHFVTCSVCVKKINKCPICQKYSKTIRVFYS